MGLDLHTCGPPYLAATVPQTTLKSLTAFSSRSAPPTRARFPAILKATRILPRRAQFVRLFLPLLPVRTVRFLEYAHEDRLLALASVVV
jgi:hypothetical protein